MIVVYAIKTVVREFIYVGMTNHLAKRLSQHNKGQNKSTKPCKPFILFYEEEFEDRKIARKREVYLKSGVGKEFLKEQLLKALNKNIR